MPKDSSAQTRRPVRICLDARLRDGIPGGVQQVIIGLASELAKLPAGREEYFFLTYGDCEEWLRPYLGGSCQVLTGPPAPPLYQPSAARSMIHRWFPWARALWQKARLRGGIEPPIPVSDGTIERAGIDLMHFTMQSGFLTEIPSLFQPHDLQHLHLPEFFTPRDFAYREKLYRALCRQASLVAVMTEWGKKDLLDHYSLPPGKVKVIPWAPVMTAYPAISEEDKAEVRKRFSLPDSFIFYPAQTWPHKNHLQLLEALARLRDRDNLRVPLVCSGHLYEHFATIQARLKERRLEEQVQFVGFVSAGEVRAFYEMARALVFPSKFEGWGLPLLEAFYLGLPVACSNVTSLPSLVEDAALIFDPDDADGLAESIRRLWSDEKLRGELTARGRKIAARYSWARTAKMFRACYRLLAGAGLSAEDEALLALCGGEPPIHQPVAP